MKGALWILLAICLLGIALYLDELRRRIKEHSDNSNLSDLSDNSDLSDPADSKEEECCGLHLVCEKDSLSPMSAEITYYDDEDLDRFIGRDPLSYTPEEVEEFRDVLMTLLPEDVAGWARSVTQRNLPLPPEIRDELFILIRDQRDR